MSYTYSTQVRMTEAERRKLEELARVTKRNKSDVLRTLLRLATPTGIPDLELSAPQVTTDERQTA